MAVNTPELLDMTEVGARMMDIFRTSGSGAEKMCYYKTPVGHKEGKESRWVVWSHTQPSVQLMRINAGFIPLPKYGEANPSGALDGPDCWNAILSHPNGPSEFPASQVQAFHWYDKRYLPPKFQEKGLVFPQFERYLADLGGDIDEYHCPNCNTTPFFDGWSLAQHCTNRHNFTPEMIHQLAESHERKTGQQISLTRPIATSLNIHRIHQPEVEVVEESVPTTAAPLPHEEYAMQTVADQLKEMNSLLMQFVQKFGQTEIPVITAPEEPARQTRNRRKLNDDEREVLKQRLAEGRARAQAARAAAEPVAV